MFKWTFSLVCLFKNGEFIQSNISCWVFDWVIGILQARMLGWVAISFSRGSSWLMDQPGSPTLLADSLPSEPPGNPFWSLVGVNAEKAMASHSSTLAWKIPWAEEPGGLQSMGSRRVGHDWATSLSLFTFMHWRKKWQPTPVFLPGESQGWGSLVGCRLWGHRVGCDWSDLAAVGVNYNAAVLSAADYFISKY